jgi:hypothetical protein
VKINKLLISMGRDFVGPKEASRRHRAALYGAGLCWWHLRACEAALTAA